MLIFTIGRENIQYNRQLEGSLKRFVSFENDDNKVLGLLMFKI